MFRANPDPFHGDGHKVHQIELEGRSKEKDRWHWARILFPSSRRS